jgi:hypothetical protein
MQVAWSELIGIEHAGKKATLVLNAFGFNKPDTGEGRFVEFHGRVCF